MKINVLFMVCIVYFFISSYCIADVNNIPEGTHIIRAEDFVDGFNMSALPDLISRWLSEDNGTNMRQFYTLSRNWKSPGFISTNHFLAIVMTKDWNLISVFEPDCESEPESEPYSYVESNISNIAEYMLITWMT